MRSVGPSQYRAAAAYAAIALGFVLTACQSGTQSRSHAPLSPSPATPTLATDRGGMTLAQPVPSGKTVATVGDRAVGWSELTPLMAEASGGQVLEEYALGIVLREECRTRNIRITDDMVKAEKRLMAEQLTRAAGLPMSESETLIANVRRSRGLGDLRFQALLERNAALRAIVRADPNAAIVISAEDVETAYQLKYGPKVKTRLILTRSQEAAIQAKQRLNSGQAFADVAADSSIDPSSVRGGLLDPFSLSDSNYPVAVRRVLQGLQQGQASDVIPVSWRGRGAAEEEQGFAIVKLEQTVSPAGAPPKESVTIELEQEIRVVRERAQMDRVGRQVLRNAGVNVMDRGLGWSWEQWKGEGTP